jgi:hypothetical protein
MHELLNFQHFSRLMHAHRWAFGKAHPAALSPIRSSAGHTIDMHESDFSEATPNADIRRDAGWNPGSLRFQRARVTKRQ